MFFSLLFGIVGAVLGSFTLVLILILSGIRSTKHSLRTRRLPKIRQPNFVYGTRVPLTWFNTLCACLYPSLVNKEFLRTEIETVFATIPEDVSAIRSIRLIGFELSTSPPVIDEISLETSSRNNEVVFRFRFNPGLVCQVSLGVPVLLVSEIQIAAHLTFTGFDGAFRLFIPPKAGPMQLRILPTTVINCDFGVEVGSTMKVTQSADLIPIWTSLLDWAHGYIHRKVITIPLEEAVLRAPDSRPETKLEKPTKGKGRSRRRKKRSEPRGEPRVRLRRFFELYPYDF
jgi:hypothetical protein